MKDRFCDKNIKDNQELSNEVQQEMDLRHNPGQVMDALKHEWINSCPSMLVRSNSGEEDWIKVIDIKSDYPIQTVRCMIKCYDFNLSNTTMISWDKGGIKKINRTIRHVNRSIKSMKARKSKANKIDRGHEIPNDDQDFTRIESEEGNEDWKKVVLRKNQS